MTANNKTKQSAAIAVAQNQVQQSVLTASHAMRVSNAICTGNNTDDDNVPECIGAQSLHGPMEECIKCNFFDQCNKITVAVSLDCIHGYLIDLMDEEGLFDPASSRR